jgi:uncharacterized protein HemX
MSKLLALIVAALFAAASVTAIAQDKDKKPSAKTEKSTKDAPKKELTAAQKKQQERRKECNTKADDQKLKGDDRKKFVSSCLKPAAKKGEATMKTEPKKGDKK